MITVIHLLKSMSESLINPKDGHNSNGLADNGEGGGDPTAANNDDAPEPVLPTRREDTIDARSIFDVFRTRSGSPLKIGQLSTTVDSMTYNMKHRNRGKCLIFNNKTFGPMTGLNERRGTEADARELVGTFRSLGFDVHLYNDPSAKSVTGVLESVSKEDHKENDCLVVCILTHGEMGTLWGSDGKYTTEEVFNYFKGDRCLSLATKPKIFFIQACQGDRLDSGAVLRSLDVTDSGQEYYRIPNYADFLIAYSTVPGYYSWRNTTEGSWFIQSLTKVLGSIHVSNLDLLTMMTMVSRKVAYDFESNVPNDSTFHQKKQIPCVTSMLTRLIYFIPKP